MRRWLVGLVGVAALAGCRKAEVRPPDAGRRVEPMSAFFRCLTASDVEVEGIANGQQVRRLVESAFEREGEVFVERVEARCLPMVAGDGRLGKVVREYVGKMRGWRSEDGDEDEDEDEDEDGGIARCARAWNEKGALSGKGLAYDRFLACVVPELEQVRDGQALYERLARSCFGSDLAAFVARVRGGCAPLLAEGKPARGAQARQKRLRDPEGRHEALWKQCLELAEEQQRLRDGEALVAAVDAFLAARPRD